LEDYRLKLKSLKKTLKDFEHSFANEYGRKPEKDDIASDPVMGIPIFVNSLLASAHYFY
jgi:hypothetical protein